MAIDCPPHQVSEEGLGRSSAALDAYQNALTVRGSSNSSAISAGVIYDL